jgi:hypothetical protein
MSIIVHFDERTFKITRHDRLTLDKFESSPGRSFREEDSARGRSVAHTGRYTGSLPKKS